MSLEALLRNCANLRPMLLRRNKDPNVVDDLCQNVLMKCWLSARRKGAPPPVPYIVRVGVNEHRSWARRRRPQPLPNDFEKESREQDPAKRVEEKERSALLWAVLDTLPRRYQDVIKLRYVEGCGLVEIARQTELPLNTVKTWLHRGMFLLRAKLRSAGG